MANEEAATYTRHRRWLSDEEFAERNEARKAEVNELQARAANVFEDLAVVTQPELVKETLDALADLEGYSLYNALIIADEQRRRNYQVGEPVASYDTWKETMNRPVAKGEKSIRIMVPVKAQVLVNLETKEVYRTAAEKAEANAKGILTQPRRKVVGYRGGSVFSLSQTFDNGDWKQPIRFKLRNQDPAEARAGMWNRINEQFAYYGWKIELTDTPPTRTARDPFSIDSHARTVQIDRTDDIEPAVDAALGALGYLTSWNYMDNDKGIKQVGQVDDPQHRFEAQSIAYIVARNNGVPTGNLPLETPNPGEWTAEEMKESLAEIHARAHSWCEDFNNSFINEDAEANDLENVQDRASKISGEPTIYGTLEQAREVEAKRQESIDGSKTPTKVTITKPATASAPLIEGSRVTKPAAPLPAPAGAAAITL